MSAAVMPRWETPPTHPAADKLPMMSDTELLELATDIEANGLQQPIVLFRDNTEEANGAKGPFPLYLLDGRNRLAAMELLGITDPRKAPAGQLVDTRVRILEAFTEGTLIGGKTSRVTWTPSVNPVTFVLSANVRRRHLSSAQKREAIEAYLLADPIASNRKVADELGVDHKTVADVRDSARNGKIPQKTSTGQGGSANSLNGEIPQKTSPEPLMRAKWVLLNDDPNKSNVALGKIASVSESSIRKARKELVASGELIEYDEPETPPVPVKREPEPKKKTPAQQTAGRLAIAIQQLATITTEQDKAIKTIARLAETALTAEQKTILLEQAETLHSHSTALRDAVNQSTESK